MAKKGKLSKQNEMSESNANIFKAIDAERRGTTFQEVVSQLREMIHRVSCARAIDCHRKETWQSCWVSVARLCARESVRWRLSACCNRVVAPALSSSKLKVRRRLIAMRCD